jgi:EmrB/QacA subfamily drug resistance transporter
MPSTPATAPTALTAPAPPGRRHRSLRPGVVLALVCGAQFMVILDLAVVNVAIPSMQADLGLSQADLQWVVITYGLTLGGFLLLGGRAADLFGRRNVLVAGLTLFALASLGAGLSESLAQLVVSRAVQGAGAAMASPAALSILVGTFAEGAARTRALGVFAAVSGSAASIGVIASGLLTTGPGWEWIFLINVPIGAALVALVLAFVAPAPPVERGPADVLGALSVTAGLMAIVYAINKSVDHGWTSATTSGFLTTGVVLLALFVAVERRARSPLVPLGMFRRATFTTANVVAALLFGSFFATIFQGTLFMQQALGYSAVDTGLAWLAATASSLVVAGGVAPRVVDRFGAGTALVAGQLIVATGLLHLAQAPVDAHYWTDLFPGFLAFGVGMGFSVMAVQVAAFIGAEDAVSGLVGGMVETAREVGGALGTAVVATVAIARADDVLAAGGPAAAGPAAEALALTEGFQRASLVAGGLSLAAALAAALLLRRAERRAAMTSRTSIGRNGDAGRPDVRDEEATMATIDMTTDTTLDAPHARHAPDTPDMTTGGRR